MKFVKDIVDFWVDTWKQDKLLFWSEAIGSLLGMCAAFIMNHGAPTPNLILVFTLYLLSSFCLMYSCFKRKSAWMLFLMCFYATTTGYGLIRMFI